MDSFIKGHEPPIVYEGKMTPTLLGKQESSVESGLRDYAELAWMAATVIADHSLQAYAGGEITMSNLIRTTRLALVRVPPGFAYDPMHTLGVVVKAADELSPPKRKAVNLGHPQWIRRTAVQIAKTLNRREGFRVKRVSRNPSPTAFEVTAEILRSYGIEVTPSAIEGWYF